MHNSVDVHYQNENLFHLSVLGLQEARFCSLTANARDARILLSDGSALIVS
jgi:hypothetical protein